MRSRAVLAFLLLALVAACGDQTAAPQAEDPHGIGGTYVADGLPDWARGVDRLGIELSRDELRFSAGCNQFSGPVTWEVDGAFQAGPIGGTEMGCEQRAMDVDAKLAEFFQRADHLELDGTDVRISAGDEGIWFVPTSEQPGEQPAAVPLEGTTWRLTGIGEYSGDVGGMMSIPETVTSTLVIQNGELRFDDGCNEGSGRVRVSGDMLLLSEVGSTLKSCQEPEREIGSGVLRVLHADQVTWSIDGKHLMLLTADHRYQLDYGAE